MDIQAAETESSGGGGDDISTVRDWRQQLEARIEARHNEQQEVIASLHTLVPNLVSSLNLSLQVISNINQRPFTPVTPPNPNPDSIRPIIRHTENHRSLEPKTAETKRMPGSEVGAICRIDGEQNQNDRFGSPLALVRSMVAVCLLERVPFVEIDSSTVLRKLQKDDHNMTAAEKAALREVGGDSGAISSVEMALRSMAADNGGVELDDLVLGGKTGIMIMSINREKLLKELPEGAQLNSSSSDPNQGTSGGGVGDTNGNAFGIGSHMPRPPGADMWGIGPGDPHMSPMPHMFPGPMMGGPRGSGHRGMGMGMGMMGMARGMGVPPQHRSPFVPNVLMAGGASSNAMAPVKQKDDEDTITKECEAMVSKKTFKESQKSKTGEELLDLIHRPTAKETAVAAKFKTKGGSQLKEYCSALTKEDCWQRSGSFLACEKVHFRRIIALHTDINLGDCSFLDTCRHMKTCKYVHYELDSTPDVSSMMMRAPSKSLKPQRAEYCSEVELGEAQWINCDIRSFRMDILGQFGVIMADPPWDIHMELPYGTMADDEMKTLNVPALQTDGLIFLWVTGRAMELGRDCLEAWGYKRVEEIIWVKTNQLQRIIRTGRTGHWLNHSKEHCLVGIKGNPEVNRNIDTDVIVAEVRETSRKPDEMYPLLERISPRTRKLELFARMHNTQAGWLSLGNQLNGVRLVDDGLRARFKAAYPDVEIQPPSPPRSSAMEVDSTAGQLRSPLGGESKSTTPQRPPSVSAAAYTSVEKPAAQDIQMAS